MIDIRFIQGKKDKWNFILIKGEPKHLIPYDNLEEFLKQIKSIEKSLTKAFNILHKKPSPDDDNLIALPNNELALATIENEDEQCITTKNISQSVNHLKKITRMRTVDFETAKLLKEFDFEDRYCYNDIWIEKPNEAAYEASCYDDKPIDAKIYPAPDYEEVAEYLIEEKNFGFDITYHMNDYEWEAQLYETGANCNIDNFKGCDFDDVLEAAVKRALNLVKDGWNG